MCQTLILPKLQSLPLIFVALVFLDSTSSLPASDCCYDRRQKRNICVDSNEEYQFEDQDDEKHEKRQKRNICIDSNEDFAEFVDYSDIPKSLDYGESILHIIISLFMLLLQLTYRGRLLDDNIAG